MPYTFKMSLNGRISQNLVTLLDSDQFKAFENSTCNGHPFSLSRISH